MRELHELHEEMKLYTLKAGVNEKKYDSVLKDLETFSVEEVKELCEWLTEIKNNQYKEYVKIRNLLPEDRWIAYKLHCVVGLKEQKLLKEAGVKLKRMWKNPYRSFRQRLRLKQRKKL